MFPAHTREGQLVFIAFAHITCVNVNDNGHAYVHTSGGKVVVLDAESSKQLVVAIQMGIAQANIAREAQS